MFKIQNTRRHIDRTLTKYKIAKAQLDEEQQALKQAKQDLKSALKAQAVFQQIAQHVQETAHSKIASVVSRCLSAIWGLDAYEFKIMFERKRGKTEAKLVFFRDGVEYIPMAASGGGVVDVAAMALRLSAILLTKPLARRVVVMDEPLKHLSKDNAPLIAKMLQVLAKDLDLQIIMTTHSNELKIGKVIEIE